MSKTGDNYLRILKLHVIRHEKLKWAREFVFDPQRTLIAGGNGTGKTTLVNVLTNLDSNVETQGNREIMQRYKEVIVIDGTNPAIDGKELYADIFNQTETNKETRINFESILERKLWKVEIYKDLNPDIMAVGEKMCFKYARIFAIRKLLNLDLPVIIDSPYGLLDKALKEGFRDFLGKQNCQQILLATEAEFKGDKVQYNLNINSQNRILNQEVGDYE